MPARSGCPPAPSTRRRWPRPPRRSSRWGGRSPRRKALYVTHMRDEADRVMESLEETFRIGRELGVPVVVSHHKVQNKPNFGRSQVTLPFIREAMRHQCIGLDCYPYNAGSTMIRTDRGMLEGKVLIASSAPHPECAGRDLDDIAARMGRGQGRSGAPPAARQRDLLPDGRARRAAHPGLRRNHDRLRRHPGGREAASAPVGHLPARARPLQPRRGPVPAGNRGVEDDRPHGEELRPRRARHPEAGQSCRPRRLRRGPYPRRRQLREPHACRPKA